jgi:hypothetical protein
VKSAYPVWETGAVPVWITALTLTIFTIYYLAEYADNLFREQDEITDRNLKGVK